KSVTHAGEYLMIHTTKRAGVSLTVLGILLMVSSSLFAHHSEAMWDKEHMVKITGVVTEHQFINPHQLIHLKVTGADGKTENWVAQGAGPGVQREVGWTKDTVKVGETITVYGFAVKGGGNGMTWMRIVKADGSELPLPGAKKVILG